MSLINVPYSDWVNEFKLPSHFTVGPTATDPTVDACAIRQSAVTGLPLPFVEDFSLDAFEGKYFVRFPRKPSSSLHVSGRVARLRREQNPFGAESMWLPDFCVIGDNDLEQVKDAQRVPPVSAKALARERRKRGAK